MEYDHHKISQYKTTQKSIESMNDDMKGIFAPALLDCLYIPMTPWYLCRIHKWDALQVVCNLNNITIFWHFLKQGINYSNCVRSLIVTCKNNGYHVLELLCIMSETVLNKSYYSLTPLDVSISFNSTECTKVLLRNGVRLKSMIYQNQVSRDIVEYELGILSCRSVIIVLLGLKKRQIPALVRLDRFLIRQELAMAVWTTRSDEKWRNTT